MQAIQCSKETAAALLFCIASLFYAGWDQQRDEEKTAEVLAAIEKQHQTEQAEIEQIIAANGNEQP